MSSQYMKYNLVVCVVRYLATMSKYQELSDLVLLSFYKISLDFHCYTMERSSSLSGSA